MRHDRQSLWQYRQGQRVWTLAGDKIIEKGLAKSVTIIPIGIGGVEIAALLKA